MTRFWRHAQDVRRDERGASTIVAIFLFLIIFTAFGFGFDIMRTVWMRASLQNDLDIATAAAAAQVRTNANGQIEIDPAAAHLMAQKSYQASRNLYGGLGCISQNLGGHCWLEDGTAENGGDAFQVKNNVVTYEIVDSTRNWWAPFWADYDETPLTLKSSAVLRNVNQQRYGN